MVADGQKEPAGFVLAACARLPFLLIFQIFPQFGQVQVGPHLVIDLVIQMVVKGNGHGGRKAGQAERQAQQQQGAGILGRGAGQLAQHQQQGDARQPGRQPGQAGHEQGKEANGHQRQGKTEENRHQEEQRVGKRVVAAPQQADAALPF